MSKWKILVIDDEIGPRQALRMIFEPEHHVIVAEGALDGLARVETDEPDLVFCDIRMPEMSGLEVLRRIKAARPDTEVIMITAYASLDTAQEALRAGASDYLLKPYGVDEVTAAAQHAFDRIRARAAAQARDQQLTQVTGDLAAKLLEHAQQGDPQEVPDVMLVEDEEALLAAMQAYLRDAGLRVQAFHRGRPALAQIARYAQQGGAVPRVVVTDLRLPDFLGLHLARRAKEWLPAISVILTTAERIEPENAPYLDALLPKPFSLPDLLAHVQTHLRPAEVPS
jgi:DNA-binding NtrC family response regulator